MKKRRGDDVKKRQFKKVILTVVLIGAAVFLCLFLLGTFAQAAGLVDDTVSEDNLYSKYALDHYQLDFYVDTGWDWLPWNWNDGIGKQVMYGLYTITNFIWIISLYLSNATGYIIQQAYSLDFISQTADAIGKNMQTLAGITSSGFSSSGFYVGFLLLFILIIGIYVAYTGLMKRETTKAIRAILNFLVVFILSASFIAYAPTYITKINDFSADISETSLDLGTKILMPSSTSQGKDSVDMIRDNLFSIQVEQPWMLLQFDDSDKETIGEDRVDTLVSTSPDANNGKDRENAVKAEIEDHDNKNLTITKTTTRLGMVFFLFLFNIGISIFVFLLSGIMIFSQILFIIYAMFLPISFLLSMIPTFENMGKQAIMKLFNVIMLRAGITLIITVAFSISSMLYSLTTSYPFFLIAFLQIVTFAGIYMKLGDIMSMFSLQSNDSQNVGRKMMRRPYRMFNRGGRRLQRNITRTLAGATAGATAGALVGQSRKTKGSSSPLRPLQRLTSSPKKNLEKTNEQTNPTSLSQKFGQVTGKVLGAKGQIRANIKHRKEQLVDLPTSTKYAVMQGKEQLKKPVHEFKEGVVQAKKQREKSAKERSVKHRQTIADKRRALDKKRASYRERSTHTRSVTQREPIVGRIIQQQKTSSNEQEQLTHGMQNHIDQLQVQRKRTTSKERPEMENKQEIRKVMKHVGKPIKVMKKRQLQKRSVSRQRREVQ
ncbi:CD3337/EF1877 family mobilome membrane protein [Virgibacillus pantothenticus]|uniref:CD3337/EF1877 family mobilome membrane protein n=1 Tax=Virgibacillus pantothenticus TaxID=1473 RepID=UPI001F2EEA78|nr:YtxH domain-containing protein [Virgibacillus pantothenticus]MEB5453690.1 YtxH domain-containing protein [Virgibacillus pantothenticus]MEB5457945.1 YtxH domain-containing protein [Virgibacillus pantothenticus]MEB5462110.1 YtxH domain-containing protein [Virgibacillus pantothenticus]MEB5466214.1 YtxH domain-containing protein [Virgibacillus pantothenticus]MEB5470528.1 YtxH domain-containing protein [Virgibacillus pantothenticus]